LLADDLGPRAKAMLVRMKSSEQRMARMIEQLLDLTRSRSGSGIAITATPLDLAALATSVVQEVALAHPKRKIALSAEGDTRGEWDSDRLAQVISNLLGNAIQHGAPDGTITVMLDGRKPCEVTLATHNKGAILEEHIPSLFDPFRVASSTRSRQGLGLGLYITKLIVDAHLGRVDVESAARGTTFRVTLPRTAR
jgi:two-component system, sensor histidine kinase and response regulator